MEAFRGDSSPLSYLEASLLMRELREYGAGWHGVSWSEIRIITSDPFAPAKEPSCDSIPTTVKELIACTSTRIATETVR